MPRGYPLHDAPWLPLTRCPVVTPYTMPRGPPYTMPRGYPLHDAPWMPRGYPLHDAPWLPPLHDAPWLGPPMPRGYPLHDAPWLPLTRCPVVTPYMMPRGYPLHDAVEEDAAPVKKEKTHFTVKLTELKAAEKVKLIKEVKNSIQGLNLVQAKKLVESLPQEIRANVSKEEAEKLKTALETAGGTVVLE
uniref:Large ribosomal subunit protein bL12 C-terminal domain-containing protein n=1 Tax=Oncorhynchus tshawytscha TaxID=74940 RepID=A0AAZ3QL42_ONCTS